MNRQSLIAVTNALDIAIVSEAKEQCKKLFAGLDRQEIAEKILGALRSLERLQSGNMPNYDEWDSPFYILWYQPAHINLAYTLAKGLPKRLNPIKNGSGSLQVVDFGCGALAMQFGLALAVADAYEKYGRIPEVAIFSEDSSETMKEIGRKIWRRFIEEIAGNPKLRSLLEVCQSMKRGNHSKSDMTCWLTALHVAYREYEHKVRIHQGLSQRVQKYEPDLVLITTHPKNVVSAYTPDVSAYGKQKKTLRNPDYALGRNFPKTTRFRRRLHEMLRDEFDSLSTDDKNFVQIYLTNYNTAWVPDTDFHSQCILYKRR